MSKEKYVVKNTLGMFDLFKGIVMLSMMIAHTYGFFDNTSGNIPKTIFVLIFGVIGEAAMPALFIISGYGFRKTTFKSCLQKQVKTLLVPYLVCIALITVIHTVAYYLMYGGAKTSIKMSIGVLIGGLAGLTKHMEVRGITLAQVGPCWFLLALIIATLVFNQLAQYFEGKKLLIATVVVSCIGWGMSFIPILPWAISQGLISTLFFCIGYFAKKNKLLISDKNRIVMIVVTVVSLSIFLVCMFMEYETNLAESKYPFGPLSVVLVAALAFVDVYWFLRLNRFNGKVSGFLRSLGRNSLYILCVHAIEIAAVGRYLQYDFVNSWQGSTWLRNLILIGVRFAVVITVTYVFIWAKARFVAKFNPVKEDNA